MMSRQKYYAEADYPRYPNGADRNYLREKHLNMLTSAVSALGFVTVILYFLTL